MYANVWKNKDAIRLVVVSSSEKETEYLNKHGGLMVSLEISSPLFSPGAVICADDVHESQDNQGFIFCHWCGVRLSRLTPRALDRGDSAVDAALSTPEGYTGKAADTQPAPGK